MGFNSAFKGLRCTNNSVSAGKHVDLTVDRVTIMTVNLNHVASKTRCMSSD